MNRLRIMMTWLALAFITVGPVFVLGGCDNDSAPEEAAEETRDAAEDAADETRDAAEEAADEAEDQI